MRQQEQHKNSHPEQKLRATGQSAQRSGGSIFRIPRGKGFFVLLVMVILASYYQSAILAFFTKKTAVHPPAIAAERVVSPVSDATEFTTMIMATLDENWQMLFESRGLKYQPPKLVTYRGTVSNACSGENKAIGTFYCPQDNTVYVSLSLYGEMQIILGAGGDFTQGYMMAHAVGHHIQQLLGLNVAANRLNLSPEQELQADCFAGLWGYRMAEQQILSAGDVQPAMDVSEIIDKEKRQLHPGIVMPENFAYGNLEQRYQGLNRGFVSGELEQCLDPDAAAVKS